MPRLLLLALLTLPLAAQAANFTVGPAGAHPTVQSAVDAAQAAGGDNTVRIQAGDHTGSVRVTLGSGSLFISGGWDASFTTQSAQATATSLRGSDGATALALHPTGGIVRVEHLRLHDTDVGEGRGGGADVALNTGNATVVLQGLVIEGNTARDGGGIAIILSSAATGTVSLLDSTVQGNTAFNSASTAGGGGLYLGSSSPATVRVERCRLLDNRVGSDANQGTGAGHSISLAGSARLVFQDNLVQGNGFSGTSQSRVGAGGTVWARGESRAEVRRNTWLGSGTSTEQLSLVSSDTSAVTLGDSLIIGPGSRGLTIDERDTSELRLVNLTISGHSWYAITAANGGSRPIDLVNSIVTDNGSPGTFGEIENDARVVVTNSLVGTSAGFVNPADGDYRISAGSAAVDMGTDSPVGGLGSTDLSGQPRTAGSAPDIGAFELAVLDAELTLTASGVSLMQGDELQVEATVRNRSNADADTVQLVLAPGAGLSVHATAGSGWSCATATLCTRGRLAAGAQSTLTFSVRGEAPGSADLTASLSGVFRDPTPADLTAVQRFEVTAPPDAGSPDAGAPDAGAPDAGPAPLPPRNNPPSANDGDGGGCSAPGGGLPTMAGAGLLLLALGARRRRSP